MRQSERHLRTRPARGRRARRAARRGPRDLRCTPSTRPRGRCRSRRSPSAGTADVAGRDRPGTGARMTPPGSTAIACRASAASSCSTARRADRGGAPRRHRAQPGARADDRRRHCLPGRGAGPVRPRFRGGLRPRHPPRRRPGTVHRTPRHVLPEFGHPLITARDPALRSRTGPRRWRVRHRSASADHCRGRAGRMFDCCGRSGARRIGVPEGVAVPNGSGPYLGPHRFRAKPHRSAPPAARTVHGPCMARTPARPVGASFWKPPLGAASVLSGRLAISEGVTSRRYAAPWSAARITVTATGA